MVDVLCASSPRVLTRVIQCRARYEALKKGKAKATASIDGDPSSKPLDDEGKEHGEPSEATRPTSRRRVPTKGKGKQLATSLPAEDSTQVDGNTTQSLPKRPRGRPRKVTQAQNDTQKTHRDEGPNAERVERPVPRKRGRPPGIKPRESLATTDGPKTKEKQNA